MSIDWPVVRGTGERSRMVMDNGREVRVSQWARVGPAMPAPEISMRRGVVVGMVRLMESLVDLDRLDDFDEVSVMLKDARC